MKKLNGSGNSKIGLGINSSAAKNMVNNSANGELARMNLTILE